MSNAWNQTIVITEELIQKLLFTQHDIKLTDIKLLGEGWDNAAYLINNEFVFRFPRRDFGVICMKNEIMILPHLADKISFSTSCPKFIGYACDLYPFPFSGYPVLKGKMLAEAQSPVVEDMSFAEVLASWLKELHSIEVVNEHISLIAGDQIWRLSVENRTEVCLNSIEKYQDCYMQAGFKKQELINAILRFGDISFLRNKKCYLHGDLYSKHIMVNDRVQPTGLIDWGDTHIGHPGIDLSVGIMIFNGGALQRFFDVYHADDNMITIAAFRALCQSLVGFPYFYQNDTPLSMKWMANALANSIKAVNAL